MAIYRAEQARFSFASEVGHGGYLDHIYTSTTSGFQGTINFAGGYAAGQRSLVIARSSGSLNVNDYVRIGLIATIGTASTSVGGFNAEIRRIKTLTNASGVAVTTLAAAGTMTLDQPTGFPHNTGEAVNEVDMSAAITGDSLITFLPGVYEAVTVPDLTPELTPQYFLNSASDRNWTAIYRGRQTFNGSLSNFIVLNGFPFKYAIGRVSSTGSAPATAGGGTLDSSTVAGQVQLTTSSATNWAVGDYIKVGNVANLMEIRQIVEIDNTARFRLNYPLMLPHNSDQGTGWNTLTEMQTPAQNTADGEFYTHTMVQTAELPSMTWNVFMRDTDETAGNDFIRRYTGGMVNSMSISADEGEMLRCSWDNVNFLDMIHNQAVSANTTKVSKALQDPTVESTAASLGASRGIGADRPYVAGSSPANLASATYPTNEPYYFSQGSLTFFGNEFARLRSFRIDVNNNIEPRFYINNDGTDRIVSDMQEQRREWRMTATVAMEDALSATAATKSLWRELILEGNYGTGMQGFDMVLTFVRAAGDTITIKSPSNASTSNNGSSTALAGQGCFIVSAPHNIGAESPLQLDVEILLRDVSIVIQDNNPVYP